MLTGMECCDILTRYALVETKQLMMFSTALERARAFGVVVMVTAVEGVEVRVAVVEVFIIVNMVLEMIIMGGKNFEKEKSELQEEAALSKCRGSDN